MSRDQIFKIRVVIITQGISRVVDPVLNQNYVEVVGVCESAPRSYVNNDADKLTIKRLSRKLLAFIRQTRTLQNKSVSVGIPYFFLHKENKTAFAEWITALNVDLVVIYSMSQLLPQDILEIPRLGVMNLHPSLLPAYRGPNPWFWMYFNGEKQGGVTLHYVDAGEDTGDIVFQRTYDIPPGMKSPAMQDLAIGIHGVGIILDAFEKISQGVDLPRVKQPAKSTTAKARNIKQHEHRSLVDWKSWQIERVWHLMRGTELWLDCIEQPSGIYSGHRWKVQNYFKDSLPAKELLIGKVFKDDIGFYVQCRDGVIRLNVCFSLVSLLRSLLRRFAK